LENLFESIIWLVIMVFFWLIPALTKKTKQPQGSEERQPYPQPPPTQPSWQEREALEKKLKVLEALGFPIPKPQPLPQPPVAKKKHKPHPVVLEKKPIPEIKPAAPMAVKTEEETMSVPLVFNSAKLQEGIILSIVLGPPKSSTLLPGWWNGRHVGLKNR
jgi:outer membrane biosynthesis protein TonB